MASVGKAFIELAIQGFQAVQQTLNAVGETVKATTGTATVSVAVNGAQTATAQLATVAKQTEAANKTATATVNVATNGAQNATAQLKQVTNLTKAASQTATVLVVAKGIEVVKAQLAGLRAGATAVGQQLSAMGAKLQGIGQAAAVGLAGATAAIFKFVAIADPVGVERFQVAIAKLGIQIGRLFIPIVRDATKVVNQLTEWFKAMPDSTRETILSITKFGLAFATIGAALVPLVKIGTTIAAIAPIIASAFTPVGAVVAGLVGVVGFLGVTLAAAQGKALDFSSTGALLKSGWAGVSAIFEKITTAVQPLISTFTEVFSALGETITPALAGIGKVVEQIIDESIGSMGSIFSDLGGLVLSVIPSVEQMGKVFGGLKSFLSTIGAIINTVFTTMKTAISAITPAVTAIVTKLVDAFTRLFPIYEKIQAKIMTIVAVVQKAGQKIIAAFEPLIEDIVPMIVQQFETAITMIEAAFSFIEPQLDFVVFVITSAVDIIVGTWEFAASSIKGSIDLIYDAIDGLIDFTNEAAIASPAVALAQTLLGKIEKPNRPKGKDKDKEEKEKEEREKKDKERKEEREKKDKERKEKEKDKDKFRGQVRVKNEIIGLEDLFKRRLTEDQNDPALAIAREQRDAARQTNDHMRTLIEETRANRSGDLRV